MLEVELVGGEYDGLRFPIARRVCGLDVPLAILFEGEDVSGAQMLRYQDLGREGEGGRPLYGFAHQFVMEPADSDPPGWLDVFRSAAAEYVRSRGGGPDGRRD